MTKQQLDALLTLGVRKGASDIHLEVGYPPMYRVNGALYGARLEALKPEDTAAAAAAICNDKPKLEGELDTSYSITGVSRFRASIFRQRNSFGLVLRVIPFEIPTLESLHLPAAASRLSEAREGLVLVTGATGQGKSTTIAALLQRLNAKERLHIVTIEDPIEFLFPVAQSLIIQREVGSDTASFKQALRAAMRQDPDVIFVGELRDTETADICLKAAETGHLIVATLHTMDATRTVNRFLGLFPADEQALARGRLADVLKGVLSLRLLPRADGQGLVPACELMFTTMALQQAIRDPARHAEIAALIERGREDLGSQSFDQHLQDLVAQKLISLDTAKANATSVANLERSLALDSSGTSGPSLELKTRR
ncbi:MAG: PilT/PilU family type 4a pilus ATPase [Myxococcaceae bacterium]|nr:PilT/PilU family type 4a pilus ATPase [Myxococcaceae bacterium]